MLNIKPYMQMAKVWSEQSKCVKRKVGACIFNEITGQVLSIGYNDTIAGFEKNCCELFSSYTDRYFINTGIKKYLPMQSVLSGWIETDETQFKRLHRQFAETYEVHAEQNAIYNLLKSGTVVHNFRELAIAVTVEPCEQCAKALIGLGISHIIYIEPREKSRLINYTGVKYEQYIES